ncbi:MAG: T9SS type A sorting domain-containing protein [Crocinitomicaceae bacterium]|nr:T9SS type A sorting domain-containing protein [Crocinitomicaceae bacterium]
MTSHHGPFEGRINLYDVPNEVKQTYAILYARTGDHLQNVQQLLSDAAEVKNFYDNDSDTPCEGWWWGVDELQTTDFSIYPNPASNQLTIENGLGLDMQVSLMNIEGKAVLTNEITVTSSSIDVLSLNAGIYLGQIAAESGNMVKRVVIE